MHSTLSRIFFTKKTLYIVAPFTLTVIALFLFIRFDEIYFSHNPKKATFYQLERARKEKRAKVIHYLDQQRKIGKKISQNSNILNYFKKLYDLYKNKSYNNLEYISIEASLANIFVSELDKFYDLLFIDDEGDIFFSIKKEEDFLANVYDDRFNGVSLYEKIRKNEIKESEFVDFEYYSVSGEPASFFISPVSGNNEILGYIVLQLPINDINSILTDRSNLGQTEEIYIVNTKQLMLTQSRFIDDNTILTKRIDTIAVKNALKEKSGNEIIEDYRKKRVFSSYEQFDYEEVTWIIIAEIDEDEVVTKIYCNNEKELFSKACKYLENYRHQNMKQGGSLAYFKQKRNCIKVDFDEFQKSRNGELLYTEGVATCTALTISFQGKFGYLLHITPTDDVYKNIGFITKLLLKDRYTNYVDTVLDRINRYDIIEYEKSHLRFGIFATHNSSFENIIRKLVENNVELSQIKLLFNNKAARVDIVFDYKEDHVWNLWHDNDYKLIFADDYKNIPDFGEIVKIVSNYNI